MSDPIQGWLKLQEAEKDTTLGSNDKLDTLQPAQAIQPGYYTFTVPAFNYLSSAAFPVSYVALQYNFTMGEEFSILNYLEVRNLLALYTSFGFLYFMAVRYRVGDTITRYALSFIDPNYGSFAFYAPRYNGELIKSNFSIEIWTQGQQTNLENFFPIVLQSSKLIMPANGAVDNIDIPTISEAVGNTGNVNTDSPLFFAQPFVNPQAMDARGPFLDNA